VTLIIHKRKRSMDEHGIQVRLCNILRIFARADVIWHAIPNAGKRGFQAAAAMVAEGLLAGVADLLFIVEGRAHYLEMKKPGGVLSVPQMGFRARCHRDGVPWAMAETLEQAVEVLIGWRVFKPNFKASGLM
jgi:hypothetical protein